MKKRTFYGETGKLRDVLEKFAGEEFTGGRLLHADCMEVTASLPDGCMSLILTDPPYGISYRNGFTAHRHEKMEGDDGIDFAGMARESFRILKDNSHAYFFTRFDVYPYHYECLKRAGFTIKNCMVAEKGTIGGIGDLNGSYANNSEWIIFCQKGRRVFNRTTLMTNRKKEGTVRRTGGGEPSRKYKTRFNACWFGPEYPKATHNSGWQRKNGIYHPTIKNEVFLSWLMRISSNPGEPVFDGFMGTGSTAVAAVMTDRRFLGAEICGKYYETAVRRIKAAEKESRDRTGEDGTDRRGPVPLSAGRWILHRPGI